MFLQSLNGNDFSPFNRKRYECQEQRTRYKIFAFGLRSATHYLWGPEVTAITTHQCNSRVDMYYKKSEIYSTRKENKVMKHSVSQFPSH